MNSNAQKVINFIVAKQNASEDAPVKIGNVEFWHPVPGFPCGLCYSIPVSSWDMKSVQDGLNQLSIPIWEELVKYLQS